MRRWGGEKAGARQAEAIFAFLFVFGIHPSFWQPGPDELWLVPIVGAYGVAAGLSLLGDHEAFDADETEVEGDDVLVYGATPDGLRVTGDAVALLRNDTEWEAHVIEAPTMVRRRRRRSATARAARGLGAGWSSAAPAAASGATRSSTSGIVGGATPGVVPASARS